MTDAVPYTCHVAGQDFQTNILAILEEVAPEIPVELDGQDRLERIKSVIVTCINSGESLVAVNEAGEVIGFVLVRPDFHDHDPRALSLRYVGVSKAARGQGILSALLKQLMEKGVPLTASVLRGNKGNMADRLVNAGYAEIGSDGNETQFRWAPPEES